MKIDLSSRKALVTGASRGIGKEIVGLLLKEGVTVIATSLSQKNLSLLYDEFEDYSDQLTLISADLNNNEDINFLCDGVERRLEGNLDIIVNNAGILNFELLSDSSDEMIEKSFAINVFAPIKICRRFTQGMVENKWGRIINMCSSSSYTGGGSPRHCVYSATKHALLGFSRALDEELRNNNVRVGTVSPAGVSTDMVKARIDIEKRTLMSPLDVAEAVLYLLSSDGPGIVYELRLWRMHR